MLDTWRTGYGGMGPARCLEPWRGVWGYGSVGRRDARVRYVYIDNFHLYHCSSAAVVFTMFQHLHGLLSSRQVFQLGLSDSPAGSVLRSGCSGTLAERVNALDAELAPHRETVLDGRVPALQFFRGDIHDVGKLAALKKLAEYLKEHGSILWNEAVGRLRAHRNLFLSRVNELLDADHQLPLPSWPVDKAGFELLARLPVVRVPLQSFSSRGVRCVLLPYIRCISPLR